jgi:nitrate/nitrite transport system substrate-binding protein
MKAVLEACKWLDNRANRKKAAEVIGRASYVNAPADVIETRLMGDYNLGCDQGTEIYTDDYMLFHRNGETNFPRKSHAIWFMTQFVRFDYLKEPPAYESIADKIILTDLYKEVAASMKVKTPDDEMKPFSLDIEKIKFDPKNPAEYLKSVTNINQ